MLILGLVVAGVIGAPVRYLVDGIVADRTNTQFPMGTLLINITGSFLLGIITGLVLYHAFPAAPKTILGTGFCGAYTTFSTFTYETIRLAEDGDRGGAARNVFASMLLPAGAAALGLALAAL